MPINKREHAKLKALDPAGPPGITQDTLFVRDTTLLKAVPFGSIVNEDDEKDVSNSIARLETMKDWPCYPELVEKYKLTRGFPGREDLQVGRGVFQVVAVSISHRTDSYYQDFGIYGNITITSDDGKNTCAIYERKSDDPETVSTPDHEELSLCDCPVAPFMKGKVEFDLTTTSGLRFVASEDVDWSFKDNLEGEEEFPVDFDGGYYAIVVYTIIPYALIACVNMDLYGPPTSTKKIIKVDGQIMLNYLPFLRKNEFPLISSDKRESVYHIEQSRTVVAISAFSWLCAEISLKSDGAEFATGRIGSCADARQAKFVSQTCKDETFTLSMFVGWILPDEFFDLLPQVQLPPPRPAPVKSNLPLVDDVPYFHLDDIFGGRENAVDVNCSPDVLPEVDQAPTTVTPDCSVLDDEIVKCSPDVPPQMNQPLAEVTLPDHYVEVFSVFVGCGDSTLRSLTGTIVVKDREKTVYIYSRNSSYPDKLSSGKKFRALSLAWPDDRWVLENEFYMHLKLKDEKGNQVCYGNLSWTVYDGEMYSRRFDRRMCAIIPGEEDDPYFAAVHYSIFRNALRAKVTVSVECEGVPCNFLDVYGSIYAEYNNHDYSSAFDKEFHRIIILDRPWEYRAQVTNCSEIPLSKSLVTAPSDCQELIISVDVSVCPFMLSSSSTYYDHLSAHGPLRFTATKHASFLELCLPVIGEQQISPGFITVKVEWFGDSRC